MYLSPLEKVNLFINIYWRILTNVFRLSYWSPFLLLAVFQALGLVLLTEFSLPLFKVVVFPLLKIFVPSSMFHYPRYYLVAPTLFSLADLIVLGSTIWLWTIAAALNKINLSAEGRRVSLIQALRQGWRCYPAFLVFWLLQMLILLLVVFIPGELLLPLTRGSPRIELATKVLLQSAAMALMAFLIYAFPAAAEGKRTGEALKISLRTAYQNPLFTLFVVFLPGSVRIFFDLLTTNFARFIITRFNPDLVLWLLYLEIGFGVFVNLFLYGAAAYAYRELVRS